MRGSEFSDAGDWVPEAQKCLFCSTRTKQAGKTNLVAELTAALMLCTWLLYSFAFPPQILTVNELLSTKVVHARNSTSARINRPKQQQSNLRMGVAQLTRVCSTISQCDYGKRHVIPSSISSSSPIYTYCSISKPFYRAWSKRATACAWILGNGKLHLQT